MAKEAETTFPLKNEFKCFDACVLFSSKDKEHNIIMNGKNIYSIVNMHFDVIGEYTLIYGIRTYFEMRAFVNRFFNCLGFIFI